MVGYPLVAGSCNNGICSIVCFLHCASPRHIYMLLFYTYTWLTSPVDVIIVLVVAYTMPYQSRLLCLFLARKRQVAKVKLAKIKLAL